MYGKVNTLMAQGHRAIKGGLRRAHGAYMQGIHLAKKANDIYQVGKKVTAIALTHMDKYIPGAGGQAIRRSTTSTGPAGGP